MRFILADWGTTRFRAYLVESETILDRVSAPSGVSVLKPGEHAGVFSRQCGHWLSENPDAPVVLVGMVGSREGWAVAPYAPCPADARDIARAMVPVDLGNGRQAHIVPGLLFEPAPEACDVMRGEETLALGSAIADGLVCLPGTHSKWVVMSGGRIERFASYMTGEMYALLREHSMIGRPATEPGDPSGFAMGLAAAERNRGEDRAARVGLLNLLFGARAAVVAGKMEPARLGPYLSGLLTGDEVNGALSQFAGYDSVTIIADQARADLYVSALEARRLHSTVRAPETALVVGIAQILRCRDAP
ncbi:2-dehydro-3-deoxygalactonokinase [Microvirga massiliensis]|uniref:2-dehydro-3-deoxygalactonokinase n=1 Tax=Microvirga massiliensis TaxID=1033741 RepID=UPI00062B46B2|nr:2-dehydro-3-deoxygalactonokinase [Microvirga massiliensis]